MAVYALDDIEPSIDPTAYVDEHAVVVGAVRIGADSSVWPHAVLRGDMGRIEVGARTSVQDGAVVHTTPERPTVIGSDCIVGHLAHVEGAQVGDGAVIGVGAVVLAGCVVGAGAIVAAGAVVRSGTEVPPGALATGVPAVVRPGAADIAAFSRGAQAYVANGRRFAQGLRRLA